MSEALRLADELEYELGARFVLIKAASELRRLHDLLGKANALCRIRADRIKKLEALNAELVEVLRQIAMSQIPIWHRDLARETLEKVEASK